MRKVLFLRNLLPQTQTLCTAPAIMRNNNKWHPNTSKDDYPEWNKNISQKPLFGSDPNHTVTISEFPNQQKPRSDLDPRQTLPKKSLIEKTSVSGAVVNTSKGSQPSEFRQDDFPTKNELQSVHNRISFSVDRNKLYKSFEGWLKRNKPPIDRLVRAGFYYTGVKDIVRCFNCNIRRGDWLPDDDPLEKHLRYSPDCAYAKKMSENVLFGSIQRSTQETYGLEMSLERYKVHMNDLQSSPIDNKRLPVTRSDGMSNILTLLKRQSQSKDALQDCVDVLSSKVGCVFESDQKHIPDIIERTDNPLKVSSKEIEHNEEQSEDGTPDQYLNISNNHNIANPNYLPSLINESISSRSSLDSSSESSRTSIIQDEPIPDVQIQSDVQQDDRSNQAAPTNSCVICLVEDRQLACLPCGHLATCVPCGHSLRSCAICRRKIEAFVRIYL